MEREKRTEFLSVRLRPVMARQLAAAAKAYGMTESDAVRRLVSIFLKWRRERLGLGDADGDRPLPRLR